jgi:riboflavin kinase / FMN adenylyltransferase
MTCSPKITGTDADGEFGLSTTGSVISAGGNFGQFNSVGFWAVVVGDCGTDDFAPCQTRFAVILKEKLNAQSLVLGDDFHFGKNRQGNSEFLENYGFQVHNLETILSEGERVSSTRIRQTLAAGDLALAAQLLGRPYSITGRVQYGDQIGRTLDFPTINVRLNRHKPCLNGIYGVDVMCETTSLRDKVKADHPNRLGVAGYDHSALFGAGHVGTRPAIQQAQPEWRLEVHFPDVSANLYGLLMRVTFLNYLHGEKNYPSLEALKAGIDDDVVKLLEFRQNTPTFPF